MGVTTVAYDPREVLKQYFTNLKPIAFFVNTKPIDIGIWNLHLIHDVLYSLKSVTGVKRLKTILPYSPKTLYNKIKFASELRLVDWTPLRDDIRLTQLGDEYVAGLDPKFPARLSEIQIAVLRKVVVRNPYESAVILGISSIVESAFVLSKNTYPVPMSQLIEYFCLHAGKYFDWKTPKAKYNATRMYSNYATDLGLLGKEAESIYVTPDGFRFTLQMQLHKSLVMAGNF